MSMGQRSFGRGQWRGTVSYLEKCNTNIHLGLKLRSFAFDNGGNASRDFIYVDDGKRFKGCAITESLVRVTI